MAIGHRSGHFAVVTVWAALFGLFACATAPLAAQHEGRPFYQEHAVGNASPGRNCTFEPRLPSAYSLEADVIAVARDCRDGNGAQSHWVALHSSGRGRTVFVESACGTVRFDDDGALTPRVPAVIRGDVATVHLGRIYALADGQFAYFCKQSKLRAVTSGDGTGHIRNMLYVVLDARNIDDVNQTLRTVEFPATHSGPVRVDHVTTEGVLYGRRAGLISADGSYGPSVLVEADLLAADPIATRVIDTDQHQGCDMPEGDVVWERCEQWVDPGTLASGQIVVSTYWRADHQATLARQELRRGQFDLQHIGTAQVQQGGLSFEPLISIPGISMTRINDVRAGRIVYSRPEENGRRIDVTDLATGETVSILPDFGAGREQALIVSPVLTSDGRFAFGNLAQGRSILAFDLRSGVDKIFHADAAFRFRVPRNSGNLIFTNSGRLLAVGRDRIQYVTTYHPEGG